MFYKKICFFLVHSNIVNFLIIHSNNVQTYINAVSVRKYTIYVLKQIPTFSHKKCKFDHANVVKYQKESILVANGKKNPPSQF